MKKAIVSLVTVVLCGCATTGTNGVVQVSPGLYMVGGLGTPFDHSGTALKVRYFQDASKYCAQQGQVISPVSSTAQDSRLFDYASAEVQFKCVAANDPTSKTR